MRMRAGGPVRRVRRMAVLAALAAMTASCGPDAAPPGPPAVHAAPGGPATTAGTPQSPTTPATTPPTPPATAEGAGPSGPALCVSDVLSRMTLDQQVGQLFMMGVASSGPTTDELALIRSEHVGGVILMGHTTQGVVATRKVTEVLQAQADGQATAGVPLSMAVDQEGGSVQTLQGPGFAAMPAAVVQGETPPAQLRSQAAEWGRQLKAAGITLDLAPVLDTVPPDMVSVNQPIGVYGRQYGGTPATVTAEGIAFADGLSDAGVQSAAKHFPGLGRVIGNTDSTFGVTDDVTRLDDPYLQPFTAAVSGGVPVVMVSLARYDLIDGQRAVFSPVVMRTMLRGELGFHGVIMSDSMSATAVDDLTPAQRAMDFLAAGGTVVLDTSPADIPVMVAAVLARAHQDPAFLAEVQAAARIVLEQKQQAGLLTCPTPSDPATRLSRGPLASPSPAAPTPAPPADVKYGTTPDPRRGGRPGA